MKTNYPLTFQRPRLCSWEQHRTQEAVDTVIKCNGEIVEKVDTFKYLGVMVDKNLKFSEHIE